MPEPAPDGASALLGIELTDTGEGGARCAMTVRADMLNTHGTCHGGLLATLADAAFSAACNSRGVATVATGFDITFLQPARLGDALVATAVEVVLRGRGGVYDVTVTRERDILAVFRGRSRATS